MASRALGASNTRRLRERRRLNRRRIWGLPLLLIHRAAVDLRSRILGNEADPGREVSSGSKLSGVSDRSRNERSHVGRPIRPPVSDLLKEIAAVMIAQIRDFDERIDHLHDRLTAWHRADEVSGRLATIPGIGPVTKDNDVMADGRQPGCGSIPFLAAHLECEIGSDRLQRPVGALELFGHRIANAISFRLAMVIALMGDQRVFADPLVGLASSSRRFCLKASPATRASDA